jgi:hypothetical protein
MKASLIYHVKKYYADGSLQEIKIWKVPKSKDRPHGLKYSFAYISGTERAVGYDNAEGKGDHRHYRGREYPYKFQVWRNYGKILRRMS